MSHPQEYKDVEIPDNWEDWPDKAKINYLCNAMDRDTIMHMIGERAGLDKDEVGHQSFRKSGLARLFVKLEEEQ